METTVETTVETNMGQPQVQQTFELTETWNPASVRFLKGASSTNLNTLAMKMVELRRKRKGKYTEAFKQLNHRNTQDHRSVPSCTKEEAILSSVKLLERLRQHVRDGGPRPNSYFRKLDAYGEEYGRDFSNGEFASHKLSQEFRAFLVGGNHVDIDQKKCAYSIILDNLPPDHPPMLLRLRNFANELYEEVKAETSAITGNVKQLFLRMIFAKPNAKTAIKQWIKDNTLEWKPAKNSLTVKYMNEWCAEIKEFRPKLISPRFLSMVAANENNREGKAFSRWFFTKERERTAATVKALKKRPFDADAWIFDGVHVPKGDGYDIINFIPQIVAEIKREHPTWKNFDLSSKPFPVISLPTLSQLPELSLHGSGDQTTTNFANVEKAIRALNIDGVDVELGVEWEAMKSNKQYQLKLKLKSSTGTVEEIELSNTFRSGTCDKLYPQLTLKLPGEEEDIVLERSKHAASAVVLNDFLLERVGETPLDSKKDSKVKKLEEVMPSASVGSLDGWEKKIIAGDKVGDDKEWPAPPEGGEERTTEVYINNPGDGKSTAVRNFVKETLEKDENAEVLVVAPTIALHEDFKEDFEKDGIPLKHYRYSKMKPGDNGHTTPESLLKVILLTPVIDEGTGKETIKVPTLDVLWLDELSDTVKAALNSSTCAKSGNNILAVLKQLIQQAKHVYVTDSDMHEILFTMLKEQRPNARSILHMTENPQSNFKNFIMNKHQLTQQFTLEVLRATVLEDGVVLFCSDSLSNGTRPFEKIAQQLLRGSDKRVLRVDSETGTKEKLPKWVIDEIEKKDVAVVLFSPSWLKGVSLTHKCFRCMFGLFEGKSIGGLAGYQQLMRARKKSYIVEDPRRYICIPEEEEEGKNLSTPDILRKQIRTGQVELETNEYGDLVPRKPPHHDLLVRECEREQQSVGGNFGKVLLAAMVHRGEAVYHIDPNIDPHAAESARKRREAATKAGKDERIANILRAEDFYMQSQHELPENVSEAADKKYWIHRDGRFNRKLERQDAKNAIQYEFREKVMRLEDRLYPDPIAREMNRLRGKRQTEKYMNSCALFWRLEDFLKSEFGDHFGVSPKQKAPEMKFKLDKVCTIDALLQYQLVDNRGKPTPWVESRYKKIATCLLKNENEILLIKHWVNTYFKLCKKRYPLWITTEYNKYGKPYEACTCSVMQKEGYYETKKKRKRGTNKNTEHTHWSISFNDVGDHWQRLRNHRFINSKFIRSALPIIQKLSLTKYFNDDGELATVSDSSSSSLKKKALRKAFAKLSRSPSATKRKKRGEEEESASNKRSKSSISE